MTATRLVAAALALLTIAAPWSTALAAKPKLPAEPEPMLYTISFVASGTADGVPFTDEPLQFAGVTDTDTVAALVDAATEVDPATIQKIISALCAVEGIFLAVIAIIEIVRHNKNRPDGGAKLLVTLILDGVQTLPIVRDGALVSLTIDSVRENRVELRFRKVPSRL